MTNTSFQPTHEICLDLGGSGRWTFFARLLGPAGWTRGAWGSHADLYRENGKDWFWRCREGARPFAVTVRTLLAASLVSPAGATALPPMTLTDLRAVASTLEESEALEVSSLGGKKLGMLLRSPSGSGVVSRNETAHARR
ncbi:MAG TPA: hypothetical protein PLC99_14120 [Verrucomicrobiota bacterium]|nr:hypothetical protein [Verrucomicrobiota bacterium]